MSPSRFLAPAAVAFIMALRASAETHTLKFVNQCGSGSPVFMYNGKNVLDSNGMYTNSGPISGIGYLQTGQCNTNGENCTLLETTLIDPTCAGCGSSTDISLIYPHEFNILTSFAYYGGCDGQGKLCASESCTDVAFFTPTDYFAQVACQVNNVNLMVAFCANASELVLNGGNPSNSGTSPSLSHSSSSTTPPASPSPNVYDNLSSSTPPSSPTPSLAPSASPPSVSGSSNPGCPAPPLSSLPSSSLPPPSSPSVNNNNAVGNSSTPPSSTPTPPPTPSVPPPVGSSSVPPPSSSLPNGDPNNVDPDSKDPSPSQPSGNFSDSLPPSGTPRHRRPHSSSPGHSYSSPPVGSTPSGSVPGTPTPSGDLPGTSGSCKNVDDSGNPQRRRHRRTNRVHY